MFTPPRILTFSASGDWSCSTSDDIAKQEPAFLRQASKFLFFSFMSEEASKWVLFFDRGTRSKPTEARTGSNQAQIDLVGYYRVIVLRASARKLRGYSLSMTHNSHSRSSFYTEAEEGHTDTASRTQTSEFLCCFERNRRLRQISRWFLSTRFTFLDAVLCAPALWWCSKNLLRHADKQSKTWITIFLIAA